MSASIHEEDRVACSLRATWRRQAVSRLPVLICALAYLATAVLVSRADPAVSNNFSGYWLANALFLATLLSNATSAWVQLLAVSVAHIVPLLGSDAPPDRVVSSWLCNEGLVLCAAAVSRSVRDERVSLRCLLFMQDAKTHVIGCALLMLVGAGLIVSLVDATSMFPVPGSIIGQDRVACVFETLVAFVTVTPAILCWSRIGWAPMPLQRLLEAAFAIFIAALVCIAACLHGGLLGAMLLCLLPIIALWAGLCLGAEALTGCLSISMLVLQFFTGAIPGGTGQAMHLFLFATAAGSLSVLELGVWHRARLKIASRRLVRARQRASRMHIRFRQRSRRQNLMSSDTTQARTADESTTLLARATRLAAIGEITATITHEVNQPLAAILNNVETALYLMKAGRGSPEMLEEILEDIRRDDLRASEVVRRTRTLLQDRELERRPLDLNGIVTDAVRLLSETARHRDIDVIVTSARLGLVHADSLHLRQVVLNLLGNAFDAVETAERRYKRIEVSTRSMPGYAQVCVTDFGCGIPESDLDRVFEAFRTGKADGLGLGLSLARFIVTAHGGHIVAENNSCGRGATVRFELPVASERTAERAVI